MNHSPVASVSGSFRGLSSRWTTPEQEIYAIFPPSLAFRTYAPQVEKFLHKNILYMLSPTCFNADVVRHIVHKTQRWALRLAEFNFTVSLDRWILGTTFLLAGLPLEMYCLLFNV